MSNLDARLKRLEAGPTFRPAIYRPCRIQVPVRQQNFETGEEATVPTETAYCFDPRPADAPTLTTPAYDERWWNAPGVRRPDRPRHLPFPLPPDPLGA